MVFTGDRGESPLTLLKTTGFLKHLAQERQGSEAALQ